MEQRRLYPREGAHHVASNEFRGKTPTSWSVFAQAVCRNFGGVFEGGALCESDTWKSEAHSADCLCVRFSSGLRSQEFEFLQEAHCLTPPCRLTALSCKKLGHLLHGSRTPSPMQGSIVRCDRTCECAALARFAGNVEVCAWCHSWSLLTCLQRVEDHARCHLGI